MTKTTYPSDEADKFVIRFPPGSDMRAKLAEIAKTNGRSLNAEIVARLAASFEAEKAPDPVEMALNPLVYRSHGNVAVTARWTVILTEAEASKLAKTLEGGGQTEFGFNPVDAAHVVLTARTREPAKAFLLTHQAQGLSTLLASKPKEPK